MKTGIKKLSAAILVALACIAFAFGGAMLKFAGAETATSDKINVVDGAQLRLETHEDETEIPFGMRFRIEIEKEYYNTLGGGAKVYALLLPASKLADAELTKDTADVQKVELPDEKKYEVGDNYAFNVVLTEIPKTEYGSDVKVRAMVEKDGEYTYSADTRARSVATVAEKALEDSYDKYVDNIGAYLIKGISVPQTMNVSTLTTGKLNASLDFFEAAGDDVKQKLTEKYPLTYASDNDGKIGIDASTGALTVYDEGSANITVTCDALELTAQCAVTGVKPVYGQLIDFANPDLSAILPYDSTQELKHEVFEEKNAISFTVSQDGQTNKRLGIRMAKPEWVDDFKSVSITVYATETSGSATLFMFEYGQFPADGGVYSGTGNNNMTLNKFSTYTINSENWTASQFEYSEGLRIFMRIRQNNVAASFKAYITDISFGFGFDSVDSDGTAVNLYQKFGFNDDDANVKFKFTPLSGEESDVVNPKEFLNEHNGTIKIIVSKDKYKDGEFTVHYNAKPVVGQLIDFENPDLSKISPYNNTTDIKADEINGHKAISFTVSQESSASDNARLGIKIAKPDWLETYKSVSITVYAKIESGDSSATLFMYEYGHFPLGGGTYGGSATNNMTLNQLTTYTINSADWSGSSFVKGNELQIFMKIRQKGKTVAFKVYITDIKFDA